VSLVLRNVFAKTLRDQRRSLGWWSLGLVAVVAVYVLPYRQFLDSGMLDNNTDTPIYQALGYDNSPAGYLQGTLFALLGPLLVVMMAVAAGARAVAGDEEAGDASGHRGLTLGVTAAVAVAAYLAHTVAPQVDALKAVQQWSPFYYYLGGDPLRTGVDLGHLAVLAAIPLVMAGLALWSLNRRDIAA
jgi:hypothetical protein